MAIDPTVAGSSDRHLEPHLIRRQGIKGLEALQPVTRDQEADEGAGRQIGDLTFRSGVAETPGRGPRIESGERALRRRFADERFQGSAEIRVARTVAETILQVHGQTFGQEAISVRQTDLRDLVTGGDSTSAKPTRGQQETSSLAPPGGDQRHRNSMPFGNLDRDRLMAARAPEPLDRSHRIRRLGGQGLPLARRQRAAVPCHTEPPPGLDPV